MTEKGRGKGNTKKRRMSAAEFDAVVPHLSMSESRLNAARAALVDNEKLEDIARPHGWDKQTVGGAVNIVWKAFQRVKESLRLAELGGVSYVVDEAELPEGWKRVCIDAPEYLIDILKAEVERLKRSNSADDSGQ
jgi:hypothetical protein